MTFSVQSMRHALHLASYSDDTIIFLLSVNKQQIDDILN